MQFTDAVAWTVADFIYGAALLVGAGVALELAARSPLKLGYKALLSVVVLAAVAIVWVHGAVGVF